MFPRGSSGESDLRGSWHVCGAWKLLSHQEFLRLRPHLGPGPHRLTRAPQSWRLDASPPPAPSWPGPAPPGTGTGLSSVATCLFCWKNLYCGGVSSGRTQPPGKGHQETWCLWGLPAPPPLHFEAKSDFWEGGLGRVSALAMWPTWGMSRAQAFLPFLSARRDPSLLHL